MSKAVYRDYDAEALEFQYGPRLAVRTAAVVRRCESVQSDRPHALSGQVHQRRAADAARSEHDRIAGDHGSAVDAPRTGSEIWPAPLLPEALSVSFSFSTYSPLLMSLGTNSR